MITTRATLVLIVAAVLGAVPPAARAGDDAADLVGKLRKKFDRAATVSLAFTRTTVFAVSKARQSSDGTLALAKGNRYRVEADDRVIVCDGATVWSWSKAAGQVVIDRYRDDPNGLTPERLLARLPEDYAAAGLGSEKAGGADVEVVKLTPTGGAKQLRWVKLWVDDDRLTILRLQVADLAGNETTYDLRNQVIDHGVADSTFRFTPPPGAEVLDLR